MYQAQLMHEEGPGNTQDETSPKSTGSEPVALEATPASEVNFGSVENSKPVSLEPSFN